MKTALLAQRSLSLVNACHPAGAISKLITPRLQQRHFPLRCKLSSVTDIIEADKSEAQTIVEDTIEFLKEDLKHLFDDQGIDTSRYDEVVEFQDPVTNYSSIRGYVFNLNLLRRVFSPIFTLHNIKQTGEYEITTRWTMQMKFTPASNTPLKAFWNPRIAFTGVSIYSINPKTGKICKHVDLWDSIDNQQFPSVEAFLHVFRQLLDLSRTPDLETPEYMVLKKTRFYEVRKYNPFLVAQTKMQASTSTMTEYNPASASGGFAFNALAGYIFGNNKSKEKMEMTTPVFTDTTGNMQFVLGSKFKTVDDLPDPEQTNVETKSTNGGLFCCSVFNGAALESEVINEHSKLEKAMMRDKLQPGKDWILARYNDPFTNPLFRRNEILIPIERGFSL
eukprot:g1829.t1